MNRDYEMKRYQVLSTTYDTVKCVTLKKECYTDDFFDATSEAQKCLPAYHHVEIFDSVAGRIIFDSSDLD